MVIDRLRRQLAIYINIVSHTRTHNTITIQLYIQVVTNNNREHLLLFFYYY
jgi:hypothetical protein